MSFSPEDRIAGIKLDPIATKISNIISSSVESMGFELVRVILMSGQRQILQIMVDRIDGTQITVEDCANVSRQVSTMLDVEDPISGKYELEVSSPGIDRPLVKLGDFDRWAGFDVKIELTMPRNGRRRYKAKLLGVEAGQIKFEADGETLEVTPADVMKAKLILTDELLAAAQKTAQPQGE